MSTPWKTFTLLAFSIAGVSAHGALTYPPPRYGKSFDNNDHLRTPIHMRQNLFPAGTPMIPCGGLTQSNSKTPALSVSPAQDLEVQWEMGFWTGAALHEGWVTISLAHDDAGPYKELAVVDFRGKKTVDESPHGVKVTLPSDFKVGDTATLQFNWTASVTPEIFYNCADLKFTDASYTPPKTDSKKPVVAAAIAPPIVAYTPPITPPTLSSSPTNPVEGIVKEGTTCDGKTQFHACSNDGRLAQCANNKWVVKACPVGLVCNRKLFVCDYPKAVEEMEANEARKVEEAKKAEGKTEEKKEEEKTETKPGEKTEEKKEEEKHEEKKEEEKHEETKDEVKYEEKKDEKTGCEAKTVTVTVTQTPECTPEVTKKRKRRDDLDL